MGKSKRGDKEFSKEQKLIRENKQLKQQVGTLRKKLARLELDAYSTAVDVIEDHEMDNKLENTQYLLKSLKETWKCHDCSEGFLEIVVFNKIGSPWYFRACNSCKKRTKSQRYSADVKGLTRAENKDE